MEKAHNMEAAQSVNGRMNFVECQHTRNKLTLENLLELGPKKDQLEMGHRTNFTRPKDQGMGWWTE